MYGTRSVWMLAFSFTLAACQKPAPEPAQRVDSVTQAPTAAPRTATSGTGSVVGTWVGYAENYEFSPGSDAIRIVFDSESSGYVVLGAGTAPPPATDPNIGYPPNFDIWGPPHHYPGFRYTLQKVSVSSERVRFSISLGELWREWCALQTPRQHGPDRYGCLPNLGYRGGHADAGCAQLDDRGQNPIPVDCGKLHLCTHGQVCVCNAKECVANSSGSVPFDFRWQHDELEGSSGLGQRAVLRLKRQR